MYKTGMMKDWLWGNFIVNPTQLGKLYPVKLNSIQLIKSLFGTKAAIVVVNTNIWYHRFYSELLVM